MIPAADRAGAVAPLPGIRGFAALWVTLFHLRDLIEQGIAIWSLPLFAVLILALARNELPMRLLFGNRVVVYLGEISSSIYMLHWLVITYEKHFGNPMWPVRFRVVLILVTVLAGSMLTYHGVEQVARRRLRNLFSGPGDPAAPPRPPTPGSGDGRSRTEAAP